jgi:hypothetical protein
MKYLNLLLIVILLASCNAQKIAQKRCDKHIAKAKEMGCLKESDSVKIVIKYIKGDTLISYVPIYVDSSSLDSLNKKDSCFTKERVSVIIRTLKVKEVNAVDSNYKLRIWLSDGKIMYDLKLPARKDSTIYETKYLEKKDIVSPNGGFYMPIWLVWLVAILGIIAIVLSLSKYNE